MISARKVSRLMEDTADDYLQKIKDFVSRCGYKSISNTYSLAPKSNEIYLGSIQHEIKILGRVKKELSTRDRLFSSFDMRKIFQKVNLMIAQNFSYFINKNVEEKRFFIESGGTRKFPVRMTVGFWIHNDDRIIGILELSVYVNPKELSLAMSDSSCAWDKKEFEDKFFKNLGFLDKEIKETLLKDLGK